ncbi:DUF1996 domain-containing protein [Actinomadura rubrisoli]|uniref:DUF1996 domain-containing protein n=1 Tax=Actinomadura rubrisoli TaxID=2530368 RepID=A0A4R5AT97_9ACTN|nr:DUF1996 domain-containing protein [Actinomadura rubrisoli]TDD73702.1 DUF1996 domain-containing protein [Actinomadura rubrisoli]
MGRKKKALAVLVPALVLVASAAEMSPAGATALQIGDRAAAAADPTDPPDGGDGNGDPGGGGQIGDGQQQDPNGGQSQDPDGGQQQDPNGGQSQDPNGGQQQDPNGGQSQDPNGGQQQDPNGGQNGDGQQQDDGQNQNGQQQLQQQQQQQQGVKQGPNRNQFVDIRRAPRVAQARRGRGGSSGSFTSNCGRNAGQQHSNPDNFVVAPGVQNGAHHIHDYVGNLSTDAFSTDQSLAAAGTTCTNGDKSTYYWPVMRLRKGQDGSDAAAQSKQDGNIGSIVTPASAQLQFLGNPRSKVTAMPRFMRIIMGDAKAATNGTGNARAKWTCSGFADRAFTDKYPLCPRGSRVTRVLEFASCWDGQNTDSANHRSHIVFPDQAGNCPQGTKAVPQLRMTLSYNLPAQPLAFALDTFPEQGHDPVTDHADFENVMPNNLMRRAVSCINSGRAC